MISWLEYTNVNKEETTVEGTDSFTGWQVAQLTNDDVYQNLGVVSVK